MTFPVEQHEKQNPGSGIDRVAGPVQGQCFNLAFTNAAVVTLDLRAVRVGVDGAGVDVVVSLVGGWVTLKAFGQDAFYFLRPEGSTIDPIPTADTAGATPESQCDRLAASGLAVIGNAEAFFADPRTPILAVVGAAAAPAGELRGRRSQL